MTARSRIAPLVVVVATLAACSSGDGTDLAEVDTDPAQTTVETLGEASTDDETVAEPAVGDPDDSGDAEPDATAGADVTVSPDSIAVDDTGVPGLDADDAFCRSWSRFGGSFQVVAVNAAFGGSDDLRLATLEVVASPTTTSAYADLSLEWPDELADEADAALDGVYGPFARRLAQARTALVDAGATQADLDAIDEAWVLALATRRPDDPEVVIDLPEPLWLLIDEAAPAYLDAVGPWATDESLVTDVEIPLTDVYLSDNCPDQGVLAGQEVTETP
ncbi:MAG: hypothetical protein RIB65_17855 [Ilumatobacter fluminis]|uniref:hypothetical protein n=1 Tax=Ilumatobacter fluminis TaxID=467091 RepID=UPI0032EC10EF